MKPTSASGFGREAWLGATSVGVSVALLFACGERAWSQESDGGLRSILKSKPATERSAQPKGKIDPETGRPYLPQFQADPSGLNNQVSVNPAREGDAVIDTGRTLRQFQPTGTPPDLGKKLPRKAAAPASRPTASGKSPFNPQFGPPNYQPESDAMPGTAAPSLRQFVPTGDPPTVPEPTAPKERKRQVPVAVEREDMRDINDFYRSESTAPPLKFEMESTPGLPQAQGRSLSQFEPTGPPPKQKEAPRPKAKVAEGPMEPKKLPDRFYQQSKFAPVQFDPESAENSVKPPMQALQQFEPTGPPPTPKEERPNRHAGRTKNQLPSIAERTAERQEKWDEHYQSEGQKPLPTLEPGIGAPAMVDGNLVSGPTLKQFEPTGPPPKQKTPKVKPSKAEAITQTGPKPLPGRFYQQSEFAPVTFEPDALQGAMGPTQTLTQFEPTGPPPVSKEEKKAKAKPVDVQAASKLAEQKRMEVDQHYESQTGRQLPQLTTDDAMILAAQQGMDVDPGSRSLTQYVAPPNAKPIKPPKQKAPRNDTMVAQAGPKPLPDRFYSQSEFDPVMFDPQSAEVEEPGQSLTQFTPTGPPPAKPKAEEAPEVDPKQLAEASKKRQENWNRHYQSETNRPLPGLENTMSTPTGAVVESPRSLQQFQATSRPGTPARIRGGNSTPAEAPPQLPQPRILPDRFYMQSDFTMPTLSPDEAQNAQSPPTSNFGPSGAGGRTLKQFEPTPPSR